MRTIKFRGQSIGGHYVYGLLTKKKIRNNGNVCWAIAAGDGLRSADVVPVNEESIAQLVGFDDDGKEIYEGDIIIDERGTEWKAILNYTITLPQYNGGEPFYGKCKLKEPNL